MLNINIYSILFAKTGTKLVLPIDYVLPEKQKEDKKFK